MMKSKVMMIKEITDVVGAWCLHVGLVLETNYYSDIEVLKMTFKRNKNEIFPYNMDIDLSTTVYSTNDLVNRIKDNVREVFRLNGSKQAPTHYDKMCGEQRRIPNINKVIFNESATIVFWADNTKTVVKCDVDDVYDREKGLAMAIAKKALGNKGNFNDEFKKWLS